MSMQVQSSWPWKTRPCTESCHMTYRSLRSVHPFFCRAHPFTQPQNPMLYNAFHLARHPKSALSHWGNLHPHVIQVPCTHLTQHPNCISIGSVIYTQLTAARPYSLQLQHCSTHAAHAVVTTHACRHLPYLQPVLAATMPAILIMTSFSLWHHSLLRQGRGLWPRPVLRT